MFFKICVESAVNLNDIYESRVVLEKSYFEIFGIFLMLFGGNLMINILFTSNFDLLTAFSTAFGVSFGVAIFDYYTHKKGKVA